MSSSSVFLSNVDDYLAPSQACVNPLFGGGKQKDDDEKKEETSKPKQNVVIPRQHRRKRRQQQQLQQQQKEDGMSGVATAAGGPMDIIIATGVVSPPVITTPSFSSMDVTVTDAASTNIDKLANPALENNANANNNNNNTNIQDPIVKASIADCLACSGCVTTAETVLLEEQHSLDLLRERFMHKSSHTMMVMTISPAAWADLSRHLDLDLPLSLSSSSSPNNNLHQQQQFTTLLSQTFSNLAFVMDGNVPLEWSLQEAAREFCRAHNSNNKINKEDDAMEIMDDGGQDEMDIVDDATTATTSTTTTAAPLPLVASSCPAVVCLVEKSIHKAVPHLSTVKSPMSMAGAYWRSVANSNNKFFHVAVMPCHDKKLEASRGASISTSRSAVAATAPKHEQDVDLVITTSECLQLLQEAQQLQQEQKVAKEEIATMINNGGNGNNNTDDSSNRDQSSKNNNSNNNTRLRSLLLSCPPAPCILTNNTEDPTSIMSRLDAAAMDAASTALNTNTTTRTTTTTLITISSSSSSSCSDSMDETTTTASTSSTASPFVYGSGGYADYIFRYACRELYGFVVKANTNPWRTVTPTTSTAAASNSRIRKSVRVAASQQRNRQRDYYQAILYRHASTGEYSLTATTNNDQEYQPVLRFAIAYGMQTLQRVLRPFHDDDIKGDSPVQQQSSLLSNGTNGHKKQPQQHAYDYIEAMACPSGCLNGGGQLPLPSATPKIAQTKTTSTAIIAARETPTQTRQRVQMTQAQFAVAPSSSNANQQPQFDSSSSSSSSSSAIMTMLKRIPEAERHATYHAVAPLQLSMGAGAGVAVQDIQW